MPEDDQIDDLTILTPGDNAPAPAPSTAKAPKAPKAAKEAIDTSTDSPELAALKAENAQLRATVEDLNQQLVEAADGQKVQKPAEPRPPRLIGQDWSSMTAAEAHAMGCTERVLCRDGYYIPG